MALTWKWSDSGEALHVSLAAGTLTLSFGGHTNLSFDGEGRLVGAWYEGMTYRRALDNRILHKWIEPANGSRRGRRFLNPDERRQIVDRSYAHARRALNGFLSGRLILADAAAAGDEVIVPWLEAIGGWSFEALEADADRFRRVYKPISILPPDQYLSLVLQATEGCSYNECSFCTFYRDRPFRIKQTEEFACHVDAVRAFMGRGVFLRKSIFLADANAIVIRQSSLLPLLDIVNETWSIGGNSRGARLDTVAFTEPEEAWTPSGINAFVSAPDALHKDVDDLRELAARNVRTLYVGLESGHDPLREFLRKPGSAQDVLAAVQAIKQAGLQVGLIFMVGVGGEVYREAHFTDTVELIERMPLDRGDLVYASPFVPAVDSPYLDDMQRAGYSSLNESEIDAEERRFRAWLLPWLKRREVRMSRYDIREFVY